MNVTLSKELDRDLMCRMAWGLSPADLVAFMDRLSPPQYMRFEIILRWIVELMSDAERAQLSAIIAGHASRALADLASRAYKESLQ